MKSPKSEKMQLTVPSGEQMRTAIANRDACYDGQFFYGVLTTGVFCKPSCASRRPNMENVRFFSDAESAIAAGFRPCKKCRPEELDSDTDRIVKVARHIEAHADERLPLVELARQAKLSPSRFQKNFKATLGVSPKEYQDAVRLVRFKSALKAGDQVTGAIFSAGFGSTSRVYGEAARNMGMTPAAYRGGGAGEKIFHAYRETALGPILLAATRRGVCFAQFGDGRRALLDQLTKEFPHAELAPSPAQDGPELGAWIEALDAYLSKHAPRPDLPLDLRGTAFQLRVWRFLLSVHEGDVVSYAELAEKIGKPTAIRAVASACSANRIGILVPCHRVLRANGELGGYRWGVDRKRTLLDMERRNTPRAR